MIFAWLKPPPLAPLQEGRRLIDAVGWAAVLPLMLAALGLVLRRYRASAGRSATLILTVIPEGSVLPAVIAFGLGMALFTILTGNAFAAFPVMATAIGVPLLIQGYGGDAAVIGAIGMLAGFCGTLMTPMAANFNLVPAALLELKDPNGVIKAQIGTAIPLLVVNIAADLFPGFLTDDARTSPPKPPTASPRSRSAMSPGNIRTSSIMCWRGRRTCSGRARCIRSSSAASTGTAACTAIGCCCGRGGCFRTCRSRRGSRRCSTRC